jgi:prepilin-type N-terminal cleavage/methylation domain-containing protein
MSVRRAVRGFTLIELMIVVVIIGILAAIAIPNFIAMQSRAKEGSTKANMHTFQLSAEDYGIQYDGRYADTGGQIEPLLPAAGASFRNPFDQSTASGGSWEDRASAAAAPTATPGIVSYADSVGVTYNIKGHGKTAPLNLILTAGQ